MKRTKAQRLLAAACGPALGVLFAVPVSGLLAGAAGADQSGNNCYPTCTQPTVPMSPASTTPVNDGQPTASTTGATTSTAPSTSGLAFTGADIEEMAVIGVVAIGVGTVLVRGRRRTA
jgi:hypothetical protein